MRDSNSRSVAACQIHVPVYLPVAPHKSRPNLSRSHALNAGLRFGQPPARGPHGWRTETTNLKLKEEANRGLLAGVRSLGHVISLNRVGRPSSVTALSLSELIVYPLRRSRLTIRRSSVVWKSRSAFLTVSLPPTTR